MTLAFRAHGRRGSALVALLLLAACSTPSTAGSSSRAAVASPSSPAGPPVSLNFGSLRPGPVKPFRGAASEHVYLRDGLVSMYFELHNVGDEPITWLNTLYDYEPQQLYTPVVQLEWQQGGRAIYTRAGRFFPSPAILQPGETAVYIMGGQPTQGSGTPGDLLTHIKYCPSARMADVPGIPVPVEDVAWHANGDGTITATGTLAESAGSKRAKAPRRSGSASFDVAGGSSGRGDAGRWAAAHGERATPVLYHRRRRGRASVASARAYALILGGPVEPFGNRPGSKR